MVNKDDIATLSLNCGAQNVSYATEYHNKRKEQRAPFVEKLLSYFGKKSREMSFVSLGCGFAGEESLLVPHFSSVTLVDQYPKTIELVKRIYDKLGANNVKFVTSSVQKYKPGEKFDVIYCSSPSDWITQYPVGQMPKHYAIFTSKYLKNGGVFIARLYAQKFSYRKNIDNIAEFCNKMDKSINCFDLKTISWEVSPIEHSEANILIVGKKAAPPIEKFENLDEKTGIFEPPQKPIKGIFITARVGSSRLANKHIKRIKDRYCIEYIIERVKRSRGVDKVVLCTTKLKEDNILCKLAKKHNIECFRGSVNDKLERWNGAARKYKIEFFVTADADDLFCEPELIDLAFKQYDETGVDFIEWDQDKLICGAFTYGIKTSALRKVCETKTTNDTEMMWVFFDKKRFKKIKLQNVPQIFQRPEIRATLDYKEDYLFFKKIIEHFGNNKFSLRDVVVLLDKKPNIIKINQFRNADWKQNQMKKLGAKNE
jgi:spore coat polysaccharide biosynthesis protein SpsF